MTKDSSTPSRACRIAGKTSFPAPSKEFRGKADAPATSIYGKAYGQDPEFYAFSRTLEAFQEGEHDNSVVVFTTDSDYYRI